jgi:ribosomal RNA-processing protein 17
MTATENSRAEAGTKRPRQNKNAKGRSSNTQTAKGGQKTKGQKSKHAKPSSQKSRKGRFTTPAPATIVFDAAARAKYLQGFSQRKQERRAYGLAMQKVKDRRAKLERRAELKSAQQEQIQEAEEQKRKLMQEQSSIGMLTTAKILKDDDSVKSAANPEKDEPDEIQTYQDEQTQQQWGGTVIVTTSTHIPGADDEEEDLKVAMDDHHKKQQQQRLPAKIDAEQAYAGNVERFLKQLKGHLPSKRKSRDTKQQRRGGQHGASQMKGVGSGADLKMAQKVLTRATKQTKGKDRGGGRKGKR